MSMRMRTAGALALVLLLAGCGEMGEMAEMGTPDDEAAIRAVSDQYSAAYNARDAAALAALMTEDYQTVMPDGAVVSGRAAVQAAVAADMAMVPADASVSVSGSTEFVSWISATAAVAGGTWSAIGMPAEAGPDRGSWMAVFRKDADGQWRMKSGMSAPYTPMPAAAPDSAAGKAP